MQKNTPIKFVFVIIILILVAVIAKIAANVLFSDNIENEKPPIVIAAEKIIAVPTLCQYPELPTGCESVAAVMVLQYYGVNVTPKDFASTWLQCSNNFYTKNNKFYGPDPNKVFAGDPFSEKSYGCFASPIVNAINENSSECKAENITNKSLEEICGEYIDNGKPILVWATSRMKESKKGKSWYLEDGSKFTWISWEHCLVLVGYNETYYFFNDPMLGSTVAYQKNVVEKRFAELGMQAVYIYRR